MNESIILLAQTETSFLASVYNWGINIIKVIQSVQNPFLTALMKGISFIGAEYFYIVVILILFWCWNEKKSFSLALLIVISGWLNSFLKVVFNQPRPFLFDSSLGLAFESSNGFPSGHAQNSMVFWIAAAFYLTFISPKKKKPLVWCIAALIILLIGLSRLYLGVHFPTDLFGGWIIAAIILALFYFLQKPAKTFFNFGGRRAEFISAAAASFIMIVLHPEDVSLPGVLLGFCAGYSLMKKSFPFSAQATVNIKPKAFVYSLRFLIGITGAAAVYIGLKFIFPGEGSLFEGQTLEPFYEPGRFIRYGLLGLWSSAGAVWLFLKLGLAAGESASIPDNSTTPL